MEPVPDNADTPALSEPLFLRTGNRLTPVPVARVEDETGDPLPNPHRPTLDATMTAFLRPLPAGPFWRQHKRVDVHRLPDGSVAVCPRPECERATAQSPGRPRQPRRSW